MEVAPSLREEGREGHRALSASDRQASAGARNRRRRSLRQVHVSACLVRAGANGRRRTPSRRHSVVDRAKALASLNVTEESFSHLDGNVQGYARERTIAVSPIAAMPCKTTFHELAHVLLGHTGEGEQADGEMTARNPNCIGRSRTPSTRATFFGWERCVADPTTRWSAERRSTGCRKSWKAAPQRRDDRWR